MSTASKKMTRWPIEAIKMKKIGVLALQGAFKEHVAMIRRLGHEAIEVRNLEALDHIDGLILPGGESTAMGKLLVDFQLKDPLIKLIKNGLPTWGTCAGMILMAESIENTRHHHLGIMPITVRRNAYGRQLDSFETEDLIPSVSDQPVPLTFIRAPLVTEVDATVEVLHRVNDKIVAVRQGHMLATSFHPELTDSSVFHAYFIGMIS